MLKALGVAAALSFGSGVASARHENPHPPRIDSYYGYSSPGAESLPENLQPDHVVQLQVAFPEGFPTEPPFDHPPFFYFEPTGLHVECGDIVKFDFVTPDHTVTAYHPGQGLQQRVPDGTPPFSSPVINGGGFWLYEFVGTGLYDLFCAPHHVLGMAMRIVVGTLDEEDVPDYEDDFHPDPPLRGPPSREEMSGFINAFSDHNEDCEWPFLTPVDVLGADAVDPDNVQAEGSVPFSAVLEELGFTTETS